MPQPKLYDDLKFKDSTPIEEILSFVTGSKGTTEASRSKKQGGKKAGPQEVATADVKVPAKRKPGTRKENAPVVNGQLSTSQAQLGRSMRTVDFQLAKRY